jgi:hypothetical protein
MDVLFMFEGSSRGHVKAERGLTSLCRGLPWRVTPLSRAAPRQNDAAKSHERPVPQASRERPAGVPGYHKGGAVSRCASRAVPGAFR